MLANTVELMEKNNADELLVACDQVGRLLRALIRALQEKIA